MRTFQRMFSTTVTGTSVAGACLGRGHHRCAAQTSHAKKHGRLSEVEDIVKGKMSRVVRLAGFKRLPPHEMLPRLFQKEPDPRRIDGARLPETG